MRTSIVRQIAAHRHFYWFVSPFFLLYAVLGLYPLVFSFAISFSRWDGLSELRWTGLANLNMMMQDELFRTAIWNTLVLGLLYVPPMLLGAFAIAVLLDSATLRFRAAFRVAMFVPVIVPMVVVAVVFHILLDFENGLLNFLLRAVSLPPVPWLLSEAWAKPALAILLVWRWTGYNMVLMLASLQSIPRELYEAARIDGANSLRCLWHITLPQMRPAFVFCIIMSLIGTVYLFDEIFVLTNGGPSVATLNIGLYIFNASFIDFKFGYASTLAYTVALFVFIATLLIFRVQQKRED
jgi:ABC-type sugar transport system permease subunit